MAEISVTINGRAFALSCEDGQENRTRRLAQYIDARVKDFVKNLGQVGEMRLLLMATLVITDELAEANQALVEERRKVRAEAEAAAATAAARIEALGARIAALAARLEAA